MSHLVHQRWVLLAYLVADVIAVGLGMGVPFFCILLGLPVGYVIAHRAWGLLPEARPVLRRVLRESVLTAAWTMALMLVLWARLLPMLFDPAADLANFGIPLILYEPLPSFIGWIVLMILISPGLQFLVTLFAAQVTLAQQRPADRPRAE